MLQRLEKIRADGAANDAIRLRTAWTLQRRRAGTLEDECQVQRDSSSRSAVPVERCRVARKSGERLPQQLACE